MTTHTPDPSQPRTPDPRANEAGKIKPMVLLWALGIPLPIVLIIWGVKSCVT